MYSVYIQSGPEKEGGVGSKEVTFLKHRAWWLRVLHRDWNIGKIRQIVGYSKNCMSEKNIAEIMNVRIQGVSRKCAVDDQSEN